MKETINLKTMQNDILLFDQMATESAANMKTNFDVQLLGISESFSNTALGISTAFSISANDILTQITNAFIGIDTAAITSNANVSAAFSSLMTLLYQNFDTTQIYGSDSFRLLSENSMLSFTQASGTINNELQILSNNIGASSANTAAIITQNMLGAFALISAGIILTGTVITSVLEQVNLAFQNTANLANIAFDNVEIKFQQNMIKISDSAIQNNEKSSTSLLDYISVIFDAIGAFDSFLSIAKTLKAINTANAAAQALSTTATVTQTGATVASGTASYAAASGFLAAGAGVLMMGLGIALTVSAIIMLLAVMGASVSAAVSGIGNLISSFKSPPTPDISSSDIKTCASGGFPSMGQMFIAREAGPELVGTIGGRNAVVNNNQIVESVSAGVYKAVREAMGSGNRSDKIVMTLDKKVLGEAAIGYINGKTRQTGLSPILV